MKKVLKYILLIGASKIMAADFPTVHGTYQMTKEWSVNLPIEFKKRIEDGSLVLWRPGLTFWVNIWGNDKNEAVEQRLKKIKEESSTEKGNEKIEKKGSEVLYTYELKEHDEERDSKDYLAIYAYKINKNGHVQIAAYADSDKDKNMAYEIIKSIK